MMIEVQEFGLMPQQEQLAYVQRHGRYLHARLKGWCHISLYYVGSFYVEIWLLEHCDSIALVRTFATQHQLEPYLHTTPMENLLKELV